MVTNYSATAPETTIRNRAKRTLNYNVRELTEDDILALWQREHPDDQTQPDEWYIKEHKYAYNSLTVGVARWSYAGIVEAIIRDKYTADEMEAIVNNMNAITSGFFNVLVTDGIVSAIKYLVESRDSEETSTFQEMQEWRAFAKKTARNIFNKQQ